MEKGIVWKESKFENLFKSFQQKKALIGLRFDLLVRSDSIEYGKHFEVVFMERE